MPTSKPRHKDRLDPPVREVINEIRLSLRAYGWIVTTQRTYGRWSLKFRNPLSPSVITYDIGVEPAAASLRDELLDLVHRRDEELVVTQSAIPPRRKRKLLGELRAKGGYPPWSTELFQDVINLLDHNGVLTTDEWSWLMSVGPVAIPKYVREHPTDTRRGNQP
jgi:hypothetical protein